MTSLFKRGKPNGEVKDKLFSKDYLLVMISGFGMSFTNAFFASTLALYIVVILGGTQMQAGILATVYSATSLAARLLSGPISDKYGRVKLLVIGACICAISCALFGMARAIPMLMFIRFIHGFGFGMQHTCASAVVADVLPKSRLAEGIGYFGLHATLSQAIGPAIAFTIISDGAASGYRLLFFIASGICAIGTFASSRINYEKRKKAPPSATEISESSDVLDLPDALDATDEQKVQNTPETTGLHETSAPPERSAASASKELPQDSMDKPIGKTFLGFETVILPPVIVLIVMYLGVTSTMIFLMPFANTYIGIENPGIYFTVRAAGMLISRLFLGRVVDKRGADIVVIPGMVLMIACLTLVPFANSLGTLMLIGFPHGLAQGAVIPSFNSLILMRCSPAKRGTAAGAFGASIDVGFSIGAPLLGALADARDLRYVFWVSAVLVVIALILFLLVASDKRYKDKQARNRTAQ